MIYLTGDIHGETHRFSEFNFPEQENLTKNDTMIILGDFGVIWCGTKDPREEYALDKLDKKNFTTVFLDGNHENFTRLNSYPIVDFHGAKAHKIRDSVFHIMRGEIFELEGKKFFAFGGARSHDIDDGVLDPKDYKNENELRRVIKRMNALNKRFRVKFKTWWPEEMPTEEEMMYGLNNLKSTPVDYILTHCAPTSIEQKFCNLYKWKEFDHDRCTDYFEKIYDNFDFKKWFCGHYHIDDEIETNFEILYKSIIKLS